MEEQVTRAIETLVSDYMSEYIAVLAAKLPLITMVDFYQVVVGEPRSIDGYPAMSVSSSGWSKSSDDLIYSHDQDIIDVINYQLTVYLEGDDPTELEYRAIRYRAAIKACFRENSLLFNTARGCIISGGDSFNSVIGEQAIELTFKLNLDVYCMDQDATLTF